MTFDELAQKIIEEFQLDPRNKVSVSFEALKQSATEELGREVSGEELQEAISAYTDGNCSDEQQEVYDAAVAGCGHVARHCFSDDPEEDIDYEIEWAEDESDASEASGQPFAIVRPC